jgi:hypothetical protein
VGDAGVRARVVALALALIAWVAILYALAGMWPGVLLCAAVAWIVVDSET